MQDNRCIHTEAQQKMKKGQKMVGANGWIMQERMLAPARWSSKKIDEVKDSACGNVQKNYIRKLF